MIYCYKVDELPRRKEPDLAGSGFFYAMLVKVNTCRDRHLWYADHIGERFLLIEQDRDSYLVRSPDGYTNVIWREDGVIAKDNEFRQVGWDD